MLLVPFFINGMEKKSARKLYLDSKKIAQKYQPYRCDLVPTRNYFAGNTLEENQNLRALLNWDITKLLLKKRAAFQSGSACYAIAQNVKFLKNIRTYLTQQILHQEDPHVHPAPLVRRPFRRALFQ